MGGPCLADGEAVECTDNLQHGKPFIFEGKEWMSVEAAFQAMKYISEDKREQIRKCSNGLEACMAGRERLPIRPDWDAVRHLVMYRAARIRYHQNPDLASQLVATGDKKLTHGDGNPFWAKWNAMIQTRCREELKPADGRNVELLTSLVKEFDDWCISECARLGKVQGDLPAGTELAQVTGSMAAAGAAGAAGAATLPHQFSSAVLPNAAAVKVFDLVKTLQFKWWSAVSSSQKDAEDEDVHSIAYGDNTVQKIRRLEYSALEMKVSWEIIESTPPAATFSTVHTITCQRITSQGMENANGCFISWNTDFSSDVTNEVLEDSKWKKRECFTALAKFLQ